jgi:hypothetical protein
MSKKNLVFSTILLLAIVSVSFLSLSPVNTDNVVDTEKVDDNIETLQNPKSSGYDITERWNSTTTSIVRSVAVSANGQYMAVVTEVGAGGEILFYNTSDHSGMPMWNITQLTWSFTDVAISDDGEYFAAMADDIVILFKGKTQEDIWFLDGRWGDPEPFQFNSIDISGDGSLIAVGFSNGNNEGGIMLYNNSAASLGLGENKTYEFEWLGGPLDPVNSVAISSNGQYVVVGTQNITNIDTVFFWNNTDYVYHETFRDPMWSYNTTFHVNSVAISGKGDHIVAGGYELLIGSEIFLFNNSADNGKPQWDHALIDIRILSVAISEDNGEYIAAGGNYEDDGGRVYMFNRSNYDGQPMWEYNNLDDVLSVDITADGEYIVAGTYFSSYGRVCLFNKSSDGEKKPEWEHEDSYDYYSVSISSHGNYIGAGGTYSGGQGKAHLFYHARPIPTGGGLPAGDDDDDDDDTDVMVVVVVIIVIASIGGVVVVIIVLIKKGIIDISKLKR